MAHGTEFCVSTQQSALSAAIERAAKEVEALGATINGLENRLEFCSALTAPPVCTAADLNDRQGPSCNSPAVGAIGDLCENISRYAQRIRAAMDRYEG